MFPVILFDLSRVSAFHLTVNSRPASTGLEAVSRREVFAASVVTALVAGEPKNAVADSNTPTSPPAVPAPITVNTAKFAFNGVFRDPKHPKGYRVVVGAANKEGTITLQDDPTGEVFTLPIKANKDEVTGKITLNIDFSVKGGPSDVVAIVNKDSSISFPDGNVWKKEGGVAGVYVDGFAPSYPKYRRIVRQEKGSIIAVDMVSGKKIFAVSGKSKSKSEVMIEFPGKTCTGTIDIKKGTITFPDGNVWTKV